MYLFGKLQLSAYSELGLHKIALNIWLLNYMCICISILWGGLAIDHYLWLGMGASYCQRFEGVISFRASQQETDKGFLLIVSDDTILYSSVVSSVALTYRCK